MQARSADMQIHRARQEEQEAKRQLAEQRRKVTAQPAAETAAAGTEAQAQALGRQQDTAAQHGTSGSNLQQLLQAQHRSMKHAQLLLQRQQAARGPLYPAGMKSLLLK